MVMRRIYEITLDTSAWAQCPPEAVSFPEAKKQKVTQPVNMATTREGCTI